jgi:hypothetical protein
VCAVPVYSAAGGIMAKMTYRKLRVFVASPSDLADEHHTVKVVADSLEAVADKARLILDVVEGHDATPGMGRPQQRIFDSLRPDTWDVFIGLLWHRFGSRTGARDPSTGKDYSSGTEEEFELVYRMWKDQGRPHLLIYLCMRPIPPRDLDCTQYVLVRQFVDEFKADRNHPGIIAEFNSSDDLRSLVHRDLSTLILSKK